MGNVFTLSLLHYIFCPHFSFPVYTHAPAHRVREGGDMSFIVRRNRQKDYLTQLKTLPMEISGYNVYL